MIRSLALVLAIPGLALAAPAAAQTALAPPALKASVTVTSDVVRIGDLVANAGVVADVPIFRAPDFGTTGAVPTPAVLEAIRSHELIGIDTQGLSEVMVTRASRTIPVSDITAQVAQALAGVNGLGAARNLSIRFDRELRTLQVEPTARGALRPMRISYDPRSTRFEVVFDLPGSALLHRQPLRVTGTVVETFDAIVVTRPIERGEVIKASDVGTERRPKTQMTSDALADAGAAVGLAARRSLHPGQPLRETDLTKPNLVQRDGAVTIVYQAPGMVLSVRGKAKESGALGDLVGVLNIQSKRIVQGTVTGPGRVTITPASARYVESEPTATASSASAPRQRAD
jgi:flagella basal body P-ring formation protein FlgA